VRLWLSNIARHPDLSALVALVVFGLLVLQPVLHAGFVLVDDHEILRLTLPGAPPSLALLRDTVISSDPSIGRVRPVYWVARLAGAALLRDNAPAWHAAVLGLGVGSAALLYATWRGLGAQPLAAALLGAWLLVAPGVSSNWVRLGTNETIATPFFVLAMWAAVQAGRRVHARAWGVVFVLAALGAMLAKESLALAAPALAGFRILADRLAGKTIVSPAALITLVLGVGIGLLAFSVAQGAGGASYGAQFLRTPPLGEYALDVAHNLLILGFVGSGWLAIFLVWAARGRLSRRDGLLAATTGSLALLLVLPQVLLYSRLGIIEGKYELPAAIGVACWVVAGLCWLRARCLSTAYAFGLTCWAVAVGACAFSTWSYASFFAEDSLQLQRMVATVANEASPSSIVEIAGDPAADYEPMLSLVAHIDHAGRADLQIEAIPLAPAEPYSPGEASLAQAFLASGMAQAGQNRGCAGLSAVIVLRDESGARQALPCIDDFERLDLTSSVLVWGGDQVSLRPRLPGLARAGYIVFLPQGARK
jgi:hypothetical protein